MKKITFVPIVLSTLLFIGCGDDDKPAPGPDAEVPAETDAAVTPRMDTAAPTPDMAAAGGETGAAAETGATTDVPAAGDGAVAEAGATPDVAAGGEAGGAADGPAGGGDAGPCGTAGALACAGAMCGDGLCINDQNRCIAVGTSCGPMAGTCAASGSCVSGAMMMTMCGGLDQPCCGIGVPPEGAYCSKSGTTCTGNGAMRACKACGGMGQPCCGEGNTATCRQGTCMGMGANRMCM
jgi:hypothetical protein